MIAIRNLGPAVAVVGLTVVLGGCALLKSPPAVQMYRFGAAEQTVTALPVDAPTLSLRRVEFNDAAETDRVVGVTGNEVAYIAGARWVAPAQDLYTAALEGAFATRAQRVRLLGRREGTRSDQALDIDVRDFEARYDAPGAVPTIVITARARLLDSRDLAAERVFVVSQPASENRVSAIVDAFELATRDLNTQIVNWADQTVTVAPPLAP